MPRSTRAGRLPAVLVAAFALLFTGLIASPAQAATQPKVTVHVQDVEAVPIADVTLLAFNPSTFAVVVIGTTDAAGDITAAGNSRLKAGYWEFALFDNNEKYAGAEISRRTLTNDMTTDLGTVTLQLGAKASGVATTPSGKKIKNLEIDAERKVSGHWEFENYTESKSNGAFTVPALSTGSYRLSVYNRGLNAAPTSTKTTFTVSTPGQSVTGLKITNVRVLGKLGVKGSSPKKKKATLKIAASASAFGITDPGGTITVKEGKKILKSKAKVKKGKVTVSLAKLKKGKHTFTVSYTGGDLLNASKKVTVKVK